MAKWRRALAIVGVLAIVVAGLLAPAGSARAADGFTQVTVEAGRTGDCKGVADIDGDGFGDGFVGRSTLTWYHSPGGALTGAWVAHDIAKAAVEYTTQCAPADINRDGAPDIVVPDTSNSAGNLIWYENPRGHGGNPATDAWARRIIGAPTYWLHDVSIADLDGDGRPDVVTRSTTDNFDIVDIWTQGAPDAGGVPTWSRRQLINGPVGLGLALGDVDGDGKADLVTGGVWRHNPDWTVRTIAGNGYASPAVVDIDRDGRNDVVLSSMEYDARDVAYFTSTAPLTGGWVKHVIDPTVRGRGHAIAVADFDTNTRPDLLVGYMADPWVEPWAVYVYLNPGPAGGAWTRLTLSTGGGHNMVAGDMTGDGRPEAFGSMYGGGSDKPAAGEVPGTLGVFAWRNDLAGAPTTTTTTAASTTTTTTAPTTTTTTTAPTTTTTAPTTTTTAPTTTTTAPTTTTTAPTTTTTAPTTTTTAPTTTTTAPATTKRYEAESAAVSAGVDRDDRLWCPCSNGTAVGDFREPNETVTWTVSVPTAKSYRLTFRYASANAAAPRRLDVNGTVVSANLSFPKTSTWAAWTNLSVTVNLRAGTNTVRLTAGSTWVFLNLDYLDVT